MNLYTQFEHGYADHTAWDEPNNLLITVIGAALGMDYVEKHVTTNYGEERTDWSAAVSIDIFNKIADMLEVLNKCNGNSNLALNKNEKNYSKFGLMKKAAFLNRSVNKGELLSEDMLVFKRTNINSDLSQLDVLNKIGRRFNLDLNIYTLLTNSHFDDLDL